MHFCILTVFCSTWYVTPAYTALNDNGTLIYITLNYTVIPVYIALNDNVILNYIALKDTVTLVSIALNHNVTPVYIALDDNFIPVYIALNDKVTPIYIPLKDTVTIVPTVLYFYVRLVYPKSKLALLPCYIIVLDTRNVLFIYCNVHCIRFLPPPYTVTMLHGLSAKLSSMITITLAYYSLYTSIWCETIALMKLYTQSPGTVTLSWICSTMLTM